VHALDALGSALRKDRDIDTVERLESALKSALRGVLDSTPDTSLALIVARAQRDLGYLLKYKPYAAKCTHPLGYSVFLQRPHEGFSFQRHRTHKVEVFHILEVQPGARVFLCTFDEWARIYEPDRLEAWLDGEPDADFDRFSYEPAPGDVLAIEELDIVHAILGCVLEEFATVSTDMVDRLHDQNARSVIPVEFSRNYVERRLQATSYPTKSRRIGSTEPFAPASLLPEVPVEGGTVRHFTESFVRASHFTLSSAGPWLDQGSHATAISVKSGKGTLLLRADDGPAGKLALNKADVTTVLPGVAYRLVPECPLLQYSEHIIPPETAFTPLADLTYCTE
jgi:hypothetical protein